MRFQPQGGSPFLEAYIVAGKNKRLNEFSSESIERGIQAFVPVQESSRLTFYIKANEIMKGSVVEVVVDGILRETYVHQKKQSGDIKLSFDSGIYKSGKSLRRGKFTVTACRSTVNNFNDGEAKVGSIEVRLFRAHSSSEASCKRDVPDPEETNSYQELLPPWNSFGVLPDCDITLSGEEILNQSKRISCRKAMAMDRPGHTAWSVLRFVYRTADALREAEIMSEEDVESELVLTFMDNDLDEDDDDEDYVDRSLMKAESSIGDGDGDSLVEVSRKRKRDEVEDIVDAITFGAVHGVGTPGPGSKYGTPTKRNQVEIDTLAEEVRRIKAVAVENTRRAQAARARLAERVRKRTELDRRYDDLMAQKEEAQKQIAKSNHDEELYMRQLNNDESE